MHAIHPDRRVLLAALVAFLLALMAAAAAPSLSELELGGGSDVSSAAAPAVSAPVQSGEPAWASDPLAPPPLLLRENR